MECSWFWEPVTDRSHGVCRHVRQTPCDATAQGQLNLLIILIDGLRPDGIAERQTPNIARFRSQSLDFENHFSGGNSSRMGIFSMFYGLPSTYWQSFYGLQREPVFMETVREQGYEVGLWSAVGFGSPSQIDRTVFAGMSGLPPLKWFSQPEPGF